MNKILFLSLLLGMWCSKCQSQIDSSLFMFNKLNEAVFKCNQQESVTLIINRGTLVKGLRCQLKGTKFILGIDTAENEIVFYSTSDSNFRIDGRRYLTENKSFVDSLKRGNIRLEYGWAIYIPLPQGWNLAFEYSDLIIKKKKPFLRKGAMPQYLFKRKDDYKRPSGYITAL